MGLTGAALLAVFLAGCSSSPQAESPASAATPTAVVASARAADRGPSDLQREEEAEAALARVAQAEAAQAAAEAEAAQLAAELDAARLAAEEAEVEAERSEVALVPSDAYTGSNGVGVTIDGYNPGAEGIPYSEWFEEDLAAVMPEGMTPEMVTPQAWEGFRNCVSTTAKFAIASDYYHFVGTDWY